MHLTLSSPTLRPGGGGKFYISSVKIAIDLECRRHCSLRNLPKVRGFPWRGMFSDQNPECRPHAKRSYICRSFGPEDSRTRRATATRRRSEILRGSSSSKCSCYPRCNRRISQAGTASCCAGRPGWPRRCWRWRLARIGSCIVCPRRAPGTKHANCVPRQAAHLCKSS